jgi:hypothetical protein
MAKRLKRAAVVFIVVLAAAQFIRPDRTNPATDMSRTIDAHAGTGSELVAVLNRACRDCHSNATVWPTYTEIAPLSWLMAYGVKEGRKAVNFSEWAAYPPERQRALLAESCQDVTSGKMPGAYAVLHPEMRLSRRDIEAVCAAARQAEAGVAHQGPVSAFGGTDSITGLAAERNSHVSPWGARVRLAHRDGVAEAKIR